MSELSAEARTLILRVGTADGPSPADRARVKRRVVAGLAGAGMVFGGGGTIASGAQAGATGLAVGKVKVASVALWLATGAGLGTVVSTPALVSAYRRAESTSPDVSTRAPAQTPAAMNARPVNAVPVNAVPPDETPRAAPINEPAGKASPEAVSERAVTERPRAVPSTAAASLAEETRLLQAAQRELAQKRTAAALALLDEHAAKFPRGALAEERAGARVLALCDLGRAAEARNAAEAFVRASPQSPLVPRLRASCAGNEPRTDTLGE